MLEGQSELVAPLLHLTGLPTLIALGASLRAATVASSKASRGPTSRALCSPPSAELEAELRNRESSLRRRGAKGSGAPVHGCPCAGYVRVLTHVPVEGSERAKRRQVHLTKQPHLRI